MSEQFKKDICTAVGHEWEADLSSFTSTCTRCAEKKDWSNEWIAKIGKAMAAPLKQSLDYNDLAKKIIKVEKIEQTDLPTYDKDLPDQAA